MLRRLRRMRKNRCRANPRRRSKLKGPNRRVRRLIMTVERRLWKPTPRFGARSSVSFVGDNGRRVGSLLWINVPPRRPRYEVVNFVRLRSRHVDLNTMTLPEGLCAERRCRLQCRFTRTVPADAFAVAKKRPPNRSLDDVVNVTSHRSPSLRVCEYNPN